MAPTRLGDEGWVRVPGVHCDGRHRGGMVTKVMSEQAVKVDGVPHHIRDLHHNTSQESQVGTITTDGEDEELLIWLPAN